ncbi:phage tail protein [Paenibacillus sp. 481]|uniref:phage tail protein n=1 Tax=Paenibacillus sp. 481 TaxID=2835869 RepID=UPI001E5A0083|nr:phage tail protein [Paenibacillus sp. 481]
MATNQKIRTFDGFSRSTAGRWAKHEVLGRKPLTQWIGPNLDTASFAMQFSIQRGMNPINEMAKLQQLAATGKAVPLIVGGRTIGTGMWVITSVEQKWEQIDNKGRILSGGVTVNLEEYVRNVRR